MFPPLFDCQPTLADEVLLLRPLQGDDRAALMAAAGDPLIWAGHPAQDRYQPQNFGPYFDFLLTNGGTLLALDRLSGKVLGCSRYYSEPSSHDNISIGFTFLIRDCWGGEVNRRIKDLMLEHAFRTVSEVWFHIAPTNLRSQAATAKLGAIHSHDAALNLIGVAADWKCYVLTHDVWRSDRPVIGF